MSLRESAPAEFFISVKKIKEEIQFLQKLGLKVLFPVKTLPELPFLNLIAKYVDGFDVSNANEYKKISAFQNKLIAVTSPTGGDLAEVNELSSGHALIAVHNSRQISNIPEYNRFALRLNPYSFANSPVAHSVRFGLGKSDFEKLNTAIYNDKSFRGFTAHFGAAITDKKLPLDFLKSLYEILKSQKEYPKILNLGGGWSQLSAAEMKLIVKAAKKYFPKTEIWIEPGERLTQSAISLETRIIDITERSEDLFLQLNCSVEAHLRWARVEVKTDFLTDDRPAEVSLKNLFTSRAGKGPRVWFVGQTCSENDRIGPFYLKGKSRSQNLLGKKILFKNISGYALAWNCEFNGIPKLNFQIGGK